MITLAETLEYNEYPLEMLCSQSVSVQVGSRSVVANNGLCSGLPFTSAMGSYINVAQLCAIRKIANVDIANITVQGDDVACNILTADDALKTISVSDDLGAKMNASKVVYQTNGSTDFLRTFYDTESKTARKFMARAIASHV